jgi:desampylase
MTCAKSVIDAVTRHSREAAPAECCGMLVGVADRIVEALRASNLSTNPNRFEIDPRDHIAAMRDARARGLQVVGFYHSHPHSEATPSAADIAEASYDGCLYLIFSPVSEPTARLFQMNAGGPCELLFSSEAG